MRKVILAVVFVILGSTSLFSQRAEGITERWTYERFNNYSRRFKWSSDSTRVLYFGEYREITTTTLDSIHVNNVRFLKTYPDEKTAKKDFNRLIEKYLFYAEECWVVDKYTWVIYFKNHGACVGLDETTVVIEFLPFLGD